MVRPLPRAALLPYTTLFRSRCRFVADGVREGGNRQIAALLSRFADSGLESDRKSTRLNSSHPSMSYGVFCVKRKTIRHEAKPSLLDVGPQRRRPNPPTSDPQ